MDFTLEVERALRVLDGAVCLFDAVSGVEPQSETVWRQADKYGVPRLCFVNKMDRMGANFYRTVDMIVSNLGAVPCVLQLPIGGEENFEGVVDLVRMEEIVWTGEDLGAKFEMRPIRASLAEKAQEYHDKLVDLAVEQDDDAMSAYLEGEVPDVATLQRCLRKGTIAGKFVPVLCGSAFKNKGVQPLLDGVVAYLPCPLDKPDMEGTDVNDETKRMTRAPDDKVPFSGLAFKARGCDMHCSDFSFFSDNARCSAFPQVMNDPFVGTLTFVRVYSGEIRAGTYTLNSVKGKKERVGRLLEMHANTREDIKVARAGDIVAVAGLKDTTTGDTLCDSDKPVILERMDFPDPVIKVAIEPKTKADLEKMSAGLVKLAAEDPSFHFRRDEETNQTVIEGMGELHLEIIVDRLKREFGVMANVGAPQARRPFLLCFLPHFASSSHHPFSHRPFRVSPPTGELPRVHQQDPRDPVRAQEAVGRLRPVRGCGHPVRARRARHRLRVCVRDQGRRGAQGIHPGRAEGARRNDVLRRAGGLPRGGR